MIKHGKGVFFRGSCMGEDSVFVFVLFVLKAQNIKRSSLKEDPWVMQQAWHMNGSRGPVLGV